MPSLAVTSAAEKAAKAPALRAAAWLCSSSCNWGCRRASCVKGGSRTSCLSSRGSSRLAIPSKAACQSWASSAKALATACVNNKLQPEPSTIGGPVDKIFGDLDQSESSALSGKTPSQKQALHIEVLCLTCWDVLLVLGVHDLNIATLTQPRTSSRSSQCSWPKLVLSRALSRRNRAASSM